MTAASSVALLLFTVAWGTNHFVPLLDVYRAALSLSSIDLAILFGVYAVGLVPGLFVGGPLSDRWGRRAVVLPAASLACAGSAILAFGAAGFPALVAGRFVVGLGSGATFSAGTAWMQDLAHGLVPGTGARRASIALSSGFGGGPLVTGLIAQWAPRPMVLPYAVQGTLLLSAMAVAAAHTVATGPGQAVLMGNARPAPGLPAGLLRALVPIGPWVFTFPSIAFAVLPSLVRARVGPWPAAYAGLVTATTLLSGVVIQPLLKKWSPRAAATVALTVGALGLLIGLSAATRVLPAGVVLAAPLLGVGYGGCLIAGLRLVESRAPPERRGQATGLFYVLAYLGFAAPLVLAEAAHSVGYPRAIASVAALAVLTAAWVWRSHDMDDA